MSVKLSEHEVTLLKKLCSGFTAVKIYKAKSCNLITVVTFILTDNSMITINTRDELVASRFEVIPITVEACEIDADVSGIIKTPEFNNIKNVSILMKTEWSVPSSISDKKRMLGNPDGATTIYEGVSSEVPSNAINVVTFHAGIKIINIHDLTFSIASSSSNPYCLEISAEGSEGEGAIKHSDYENLIIC